MTKINQNRLRFNKKTKEKLTQSIEPLEKKYFFIFMIWKVSLISWSKIINFLLKIFKTRKRQKTPLQERRFSKIQELVDQILNPLNKPFITLILLLSSMGGIYFFKNHWRLSVFDLFTNKLLYSQAQTNIHNWRTFEIADSPHLLKRYSIKLTDKNIRFINNKEPILIYVTPYTQNQFNQLHFGFILLNTGSSEDSNKSYNFFEGSKYLIYLQSSNSNIFDAIPIKMEAISLPSTIEPPLFEKSNNLYQLSSNRLFKKIKVKSKFPLNKWKCPKRYYRKRSIFLKQVIQNASYTSFKKSFKTYKKISYFDLEEEELFQKADSMRNLETALRNLSLQSLSLESKILDPQKILPDREEFLNSKQSCLKSSLTSLRINFEKNYVKGRDFNLKHIYDKLQITPAAQQKLDFSPDVKKAEELVKISIQDAYKELFIKLFHEDYEKQLKEKKEIISNIFKPKPRKFFFIKRPDYIPILPNYKELILKRNKEEPVSESFAKYYKEILEIANLSFTNEDFRPRLCSGYKYPDIKKRRGQIYISTKPRIIKSMLPETYRKLLSKRLLKKVNNRIIYPTIDLVKPHIPQYRKDQKIFRTYRSNTTNQLNQVQKFVMFYLRKYFSVEDRQFRKIYEETTQYSWLAISKLGFYALVFWVWQRVYQKRAEEFVTAFIDLLHFFGIIEDIEFFKEELGLDVKEKNYRAIRKVDKRYKDIVGMATAMESLSNSLWYLRARNSFFSNIFKIFQNKNNFSSELEPVLLVGPPGTGKTILIQAFAGEAGVPVLLQSGGVLKNFKQRGKGAKSIRAIFHRARRESPCIVFIDEVDSIGARRPGISLNTQGWKDTVEKLTNIERLTTSLDDLKSFFPESEYMDIDELDAKLREAEEIQFGETLIDAKERREKRIDVLQEIELKRMKHSEQLGMLTQLLIELDGLNPIKDILVFGATNRPFVLDPALIRSGRFAKVCKLQLPSSAKRIDLLKLYTRLMGETNIKESDSSSWAYLAQRLEGLTAADIATIVNESALMTGTKQQTHSVKSIEAGIERVISYRPVGNFSVYKRELRQTILSIRHRWFLNNFFMKNYQLKFHSKKFLKIKKAPIFKTHDQIKKFIFKTQWKKIAYYNAGQAIVQILLPNHPSSVYFALQKRIKNFRYGSMHGLVLNFMDHLRYRSDLESRLIGLLAGKASEYLSISSSIREKVQKTAIPRPGDLTNIGWSEVTGANLLSFIMVDKWYFYGHLLCIFQHHPLLRSLNAYEYEPDEITFFNAIFEEKSVEIKEKNRLIAGGQRKSYPTWWVKQIMEEESFFDRVFMKWYRIYLPEPGEDERNIEWCPPEEHYIAADIKGVLSILYWEKVLTLMYDHLHHSLLLNSINVAYSLLNNRRELLDYLVDFVLRHEKVRKPQINILTKPFLRNTEIFKNEMFGFKNLTDEDDEVTLSRDWGEFSRRKYSRTLSLEQIKECSIAKNQPDQEMIDLFARLELDDSLLKYLSGFGPDPE